jgi:hypothetical protein
VLATTEIDLMIVRHDHGDRKRQVRAAGNSKVLRGGPREFLLPADRVDKFEVFCNCAAEIGRASSAVAYVLSVDITRTMATSKLFMRALVQPS